MNTLSITLLSIGLIITSIGNIEQNEKIAQLSERIQILEAGK